MKTHDHMKPHQCLTCNRGYSTAAALTSHMQNHKRNNINGDTRTKSSLFINTKENLIKSVDTKCSNSKVMNEKSLNVDQSSSSSPKRIKESHLTSSPTLNKVNKIKFN